MSFVAKRRASENGFSGLTRSSVVSDEAVNLALLSVTYSPHGRHPSISDYL
jgi:hypothetical protein